MNTKITRAEGIKKVYRKCSRFKNCNVNNCPLSHEYPNMVVDTDDLQTKCTIAKNYRHRIGIKYPKTLRYQGLKLREWSAKQRWDALPESEKEKIRNRAKQMAEKLHNKSND